MTAWRGVDNKVDASRAVRLPEGEHPPSVTARHGVDNEVDASRAVRLLGGGIRPA